jgi:Cep192 domain 4
MSTDAGDRPPGQPPEEPVPEQPPEEPAPEQPPDEPAPEQAPDEPAPEQPPEEPAREPRPWDDIEVPELEEGASRLTPTAAEPPRPRRRQNRYAILVGLLVLAAIGFLIWYFFFRSDDETQSSSETPPGSVAPASLDFGDQDVGRRSPPQAVTLANTGGRPLGIESIELTGPNRKSFSIAKATTCEPVRPLNEAETCAIAIRFRPTGQGDRTATLAVRVSGMTQPLKVALGGIGVGEPEVSLEATGIELGEVELGAEPTAGQVTLTNRGNVALTIETIELEGEAATNFDVLSGSKRCSPSRAVKPRRSCVLAVRFSPTEIGARTATLVVRHDAPAGVSQIQLHGAGVGVPKGTVSPNEIAFGSVRVNRRSSPETVTFENTGTAAVTIAAVSISGGDARDFRIAAATCEAGTKVRPGETCTVDVRFRPRTRGVHESLLAIEANTPAGEHGVDLRGRGTRASG